MDDLRGVYVVKSHPKYMNGEWNEEQILRHFLDCFDYGIHKDGVVSTFHIHRFYAIFIITSRSTVKNLLITIQVLVRRLTTMRTSI